MIMKEKLYVQDFEYYSIAKQMCMFHDHDYMKNKPDYWISDWQLEEIVLLDQM